MIAGQASLEPPGQRRSRLLRTSRCMRRGGPCGSRRIRCPIEFQPGQSLPNEAQVPDMNLSVSVRGQQLLSVLTETETSDFGDRGGLEIGQHARRLGLKQSNGPATVSDRKPLRIRTKRHCLQKRVGRFRWQGRSWLPAFGVP